MQQNKIFPITIIGFTDSERKLLRSMFLLTTERERGYMLVERAEDPPGHIVLVNGDDSDAVSYSHNSTSPKHPTHAPRLYIGHSAVDKNTHKTISRPMTITRLLEALDAITAINPNEQPAIIPLQRTGTTATRRNEAPVKPVAPQHRALIIDDSITVRETIRTSLGPLNILLEFTETGKQALNILQHYNHDLIFIDSQLRDLNAFHLCKSIKTNPNTRATRICILSNKPSTLDKIRSNMAGCDLFLIKPLQSEELTQHIKNLLYLGEVFSIKTQHI